MKILLVEDDKVLSQFVTKGLQQEGFIVENVRTGNEGLDLATESVFDVLIIDIMLPGLDGIDLIHRLRTKGIATPVLVLSAKASVDDRVRGLMAGGDDYLVKPFAFAELVARIQSLMRRAKLIPEPQELKVENLILDLVRHKATRDGKLLDLKSGEWALLEFLVRNTGRVVSKTMIMEHVWDFNFDPQTNVVESRICRLRDKVDRPFEHKLIHTIRGAGYVLEVRG
ncbi:MAG: response regulator transcription factor [Candidatus Nitronauta litoralis]|uniref:Response regulator transcription factor n=1 Tax=Candidatus Nitronauta litoralis TaxID=2705533 RepID=A0A7T0BYP2_9BACT|nr:MAG: response regulator transcription factor [Candidatus Nitronauta litoralis]